LAECNFIPQIAFFFYSVYFGSWRKWLYGRVVFLMDKIMRHGLSDPKVLCL
jgi:hypothetical protein